MFIKKRDGEEPVCRQAGTNTGKGLICGVIPGECR